MICQSEIIFVVQYIQVLDYALIADVSAGKADHLVEDRQSITHTTVSFQGNHIQCFRFGGNSFLRRYVCQMSNGVFHTDTVKIIDLAAGKDGWQNLMLLRSSQNEDGVAWRFFQCFQESIESRGRQHVYLIDDIYLIFTYLGRNAYLLYQLADIVYGVVGRGIQFMNIV